MKAREIGDGVITFTSCICSDYFTLPVIPSKKTFHITSSGPSYHPSGIPSVAICVHTSPFPCITPTTFPSSVPSDKPMMLVL